MQDYNKRYTVSTHEGTFVWNPQDIVHIQADGNYSTVFLLSGKHFISRTLKLHQKELKRFGGFLRLHRSYIVNIYHVFSIIKGRVKLSNKVEIPGSKAGIRLLKYLLGKL